MISTKRLACESHTNVRNHKKRTHTMTTIIFISTFLLTFGFVQLKEALDV